jgi:hypothetical protein
MAKVYGCWKFRRQPEVTEEEFEQAAHDIDGECIGEI